MKATPKKKKETKPITSTHQEIFKFTYIFLLVHIIPELQVLLYADFLNTVNLGHTTSNKF